MGNYVKVFSSAGMSIINFQFLESKWISSRCKVEKKRQNPNRRSFHLDDLDGSEFEIESALTTKTVETRKF